MVLAAACLTPLAAQMLDDHLMLPKKTIFTGFLYSYERWDQYWQGTLKRVNGNIGTVTTRTSTLYGDYGVTNRLNVIASVPYVSTEASQGVLAGQKGWQDFTLGVKYRVLTRAITDSAKISLFGVAFGGTPMTDYTPDFQPLSIGLASRRVGGRVIVNCQTNSGWYVTGTASNTWRGNVKLDRPYYFTEDQLFLSDDVPMPDVVDYSVGSGYFKKGRMAQFTFAKQITEGGGDIRRQDAPFVSNRFIYCKLKGMLMYPVPKLRPLAVRFEISHVIDGRNVGQATTITVGLLGTFSLGRGTR